MAPKSRERVHSDVESSGDEGAIKNLDYKPPKDFSLYKAKKHTTSVFDVDETAKHELWLIRVPEGISNEDLSTMSLTLPPESTPSSSASKETLTLGSLKKKEAFSNSSSATTTKYQLQTISPESGFAGEMLALHALVPDSSKGGRLVQAPLGVRRHLALLAQPSIPSGAPLAEEILSRPIPKREQPDGLKMRFQFSGSETQVPGTKLSGSGKEFAARWAKTLERRRREQEEELLRVQQAEEGIETEAEVESEQAAEAGESEIETEETTAIDKAEEEADEEEQEEVKAEAVPGKKRKGDHMDMDSAEERKIKKERKDRKDKKEKKEKKEKKAKRETE
ncbi:hypothetical protein BC939DRAFT_503521 [Gamsiella multidivaricata]|uniref:uncharacterized protein n=1 Tax=Gamsiella multidivaricata TaxID=101098 RepID=UPI00221E5786|nr:uncharacterized protein BC939DRAFT_503521 [Gamsiella multidivaricata]KAG0368842.1 hypothetical protein BGZ54_001040 [Gamsiella multidivaricata]KAI7823056.1 hypothetical protein BC939DRAFT_503521 [Gamsiella multidivaricata]